MSRFSGINFYIRISKHFGYGRGTIENFFFGGFKNWVFFVKEDFFSEER